MELLIYGMILLLSLEQVVNVPFKPRRKLQPKFLPTPTNITAHRGELVVLKCHIKDLGPKMVVWRKRTQDVPFTIGEAMFSQEKNMDIEIHKLSEDETQYDLIIKDVQPRHSGTYLCQVTATKLYTHYVTLQVLDEPGKTPKRIQIAGTEFVDQGMQIFLRCNVTGISRAPGDVDWFFNGERIMTSLPQWQGRTQILRRTRGRMYISELIVDRSTLNDKGTYVCRSSGNSDLDVDSIVVNVLSADKPNVSRRDKESLQQPIDPGSSSSAVVFQHSPLLHIITIALCVTLSLNTNNCVRYSIFNFIYCVTVLIGGHFTQR